MCKGRNSIADTPSTMCTWVLTTVPWLQPNNEVQELLSQAFNSFGTQGVTLLCDVSTGHARPIVPASWRHQVFNTILSHPSVCTTQKLIVSRFVWSGLQKQVGIWAKQCIPCQSSKSRHTSKPHSRSSASLNTNLITFMWTL